MQRKVFSRKNRNKNAENIRQILDEKKRWLNGIKNHSSEPFTIAIKTRASIRKKATSDVVSSTASVSVASPYAHRAVRVRKYMDSRGRGASLSCRGLRALCLRCRIGRPFGSSRQLELRHFGGSRLAGVARNVAIRSVARRNRTRAAGEWKLPQSQAAAAAPEAERRDWFSEVLGLLQMMLAADDKWPEVTSPSLKGTPQEKRRLTNGQFI